MHAKRCRRMSHCTGRPRSVKRRMLEGERENGQGLVRIETGAVREVAEGEEW